MAIRHQVEQEFYTQKNTKSSELENTVNAKLSELGQMPWKDLGKGAMKFILTKAAGQVPIAGGGIAWVLDQALTEQPPGQPIGNALTQLAVVREFHAAVLGMLAPGMGRAWDWPTAVKHLAIMARAVAEAKKQLAEARRAIDKIEHILVTNYHDVAVHNLLESIIDKEAPAIEMTSLSRRAPLKPLSPRW